PSSYLTPSLQAPASLSPASDFPLWGKYADPKERPLSMIFSGAPSILPAPVCNIYQEALYPPGPVPPAEVCREAPSQGSASLPCCGFPPVPDRYTAPRLLFRIPCIPCRSATARPPRLRTPGFWRRPLWRRRRKAGWQGPDDLPSCIPRRCRLSSDGTGTAGY